MAEFLAGASGWYDHEPQKSLDQQPANAVRPIESRVLRIAPVPNTDRMQVHRHCGPNTAQQNI